MAFVVIPTRTDNVDANSAADINQLMENFRNSIFYVDVTNSRVGIGTNSPTGTLSVTGNIIQIYDTTNSQTESHVTTRTETITSSDTYYVAGYECNFYSKISTGITNSGQTYGIVIKNYRNGVVNDLGTLTDLHGQLILYGHYNTDASTPTTTTAFGLKIIPKAQTGTITNLYSIYIDNIVTGGTVTNKWSIYSPDDTADMHHDGRIGVGTATFSANGGKIQVSNGISFPASQSACSDVNTLDDYEEGTFSPTITSTGGGTATYTSQYGFYTKIGNRVFINGTIVISNHTGSGNMSIGGLPFTVSSGTGYNAAASFGYVNNVALTAGYILCGYVDPSATSINLGQIPSGGGAQAAVPLDTAFGIVFSISYIV